MSEYVVHFTKQTQNGSAYDNMMSILWNRILQAGPFGLARRLAPDPDSQASVCFSEVPLHLVQRIAQERGNHGIGFTKQFMIERGGNPIWYVERGSTLHDAIRAMTRETPTTLKPANDRIWQITPFIDVRGVNYQFEWEREWRHRGHLNFEVEDVAFLFIPEELHEAAREFFEEALRENTGPAYFCPYIDVGWSQERVRQALMQQD